MTDRLTEMMELFAAGQSDEAYRFMGCHPDFVDWEHGYSFRVWAPRARSVSVVGDFNFWNTLDLPMHKDAHGVWWAFSRYAKAGDKYKFYVEKCNGGFEYKNDPYAFKFAELPDTSGIICEEIDFPWTDESYFKRTRRCLPLEKPINIYELHIGSWKLKADGSPYNYEELADVLIPYVKEMGFTHVELLPITEYPYPPSWGYQVTGYYAPTHRYGTPTQFKAFVDKCHSENIGVILDWVPAHFPKDSYGLYEFDGTSCYELSDPVMNEHPEWNTRIFDYGRNEVSSFLISSAAFWLREYHVDGLRVDAVASMLYLDYGRKTYVPNKYGGKYNLEAIEFLKKLNRAAFNVNPGVLMIAEESTAFPQVTKPTYTGGLGFNFKWNMGWMNDILSYMSNDPLFRKGDHNRLTFSLTYSLDENYVLPLSHDEVVHGKLSMIGRMPGEYESKFAELRLLYAYMMAHPGKKLTFMGNEYGQFIEWDYKKELDWFLLEYEMHDRLRIATKELNRFYLNNKTLWQIDDDWSGFQWITADDRDQSVVAFRRIDKKGNELICIFNFCPVTRYNYRIGLPRAGRYAPVFSTDRLRYGGKGTPLKMVDTQPVSLHGLCVSGCFTLPATSAVFYKITKKCLEGIK